MEGHDVWGGGQIPTHPVENHDQLNQLQAEIYQGFQQQYHLELEDWKNAASTQYDQILQEQTREFEERLRKKDAQFAIDLDQWKQHVDRLKKTWNEDVIRKVGIERENNQYQLSTKREIRELRKTVSTLEMELSRAKVDKKRLEEQHLDYNQHLLKKITFLEDGKESLLLKITKLQTHGDKQGWEIQKLNKEVEDLYNQLLQHFNTSL